MAATRTTKHRSPSDLRLPAVADPTRLGAAYEVLHSSDTRLNRHSHENINSTSDQGASPDPLSGFRRCVGSTFTPVATDSQITRSGILALGHGQEVSTLGLSPVGDTKVVGTGNPLPFLLPACNIPTGVRGGRHYEVNRSRKTHVRLEVRTWPTAE